MEARRGGRISASFLSKEEESELACSNKKEKDIHHANFDSHMNDGHAPFSHKQSAGRLPLSFRDKLVGEIPSAYSQAFNFTKHMDDDEESDSETSGLREGLIAIKFTKEQKRRFRSPGNKALIVKVYGRSVGFSFLHTRLFSVWKPVGKIDCVDLGKEFFLIHFSVKEDCEAVPRNEPWFIGENFLSIRPWKPNFHPSEANKGAQS